MNPSRNLHVRVLFAALAVAAFDTVFGFGLCKFTTATCTVPGFFRGIATYAPLGFPGYRTAQLGALMHIGVATCWTCAYTLVYTKSSALQRSAATIGGVLAAAVAVGFIVWLTMDLVVLPVVGHGRHTSVTSRNFWILLFGHPIFVGLPITAVVRKG